MIIKEQNTGIYWLDTLPGYPVVIFPIEKISKMDKKEINELATTFATSCLNEANNMVVVDPFTRKRKASLNNVADLVFTAIRENKQIEHLIKSNHFSTGMSVDLNSNHVPGSLMFIEKIEGVAYGDYHHVFNSFQEGYGITHPPHQDYEFDRLVLSTLLVIHESLHSYISYIQSLKARKDWYNGSDFGTINTMAREFSLFAYEAINSVFSYEGYEDILKNGVRDLKEEALIDSVSLTGLYRAYYAILKENDEQYSTDGKKFPAQHENFLLYPLRFKENVDSYEMFGTIRPAFTDRNSTLGVSKTKYRTGNMQINFMKLIAHLAGEVFLTTHSSIPHDTDQRVENSEVIVKHHEHNLYRVIMGLFNMNNVNYNLFDPPPHTQIHTLKESIDNVIEPQPQEPTTTTTEPTPEKEKTNE